MAVRTAVVRGSVVGVVAVALARRRRGRAWVSRVSWRSRRGRRRVGSLVRVSRARLWLVVMLLSPERRLVVLLDVGHVSSVVGVLLVLLPLLVLLTMVVVVVLLLVLARAAVVGRLGSDKSLDESARPAVRMGERQRQVSG